MLTISEIAATIAIWVLIAIGIYFSIRAALRRKKSISADNKRSQDSAE